MCGVGLIIDRNRQLDVTNEAVKIAEGLQHRGELGMGIAVLRHMLHIPLIGHGLVREVAPEHLVKHLNEHSAIVHTWYATSGVRSESFAQPFPHNSTDPNKKFAFTFNGNITNFVRARDELLQEGVDMGRQVDTELLLQLMIQSIQQQTTVDLVEVFTKLEEKLDGAYTIAWLNEAGEAAVYRSANGIKPMVYGFHDSLVMAASEDSALTSVYPNAQLYDLEPGTMLHVTGSDVTIEKIKEDTRALCFFEGVYFASVASKLDGISVNEVRFQSGIKLAQHETEDLSNAVVVPVPESALAAANGYAQETKLSVATGLTKNLHGGRTFIAGEDKRRTKVKVKYTIHPDVLAGKDVLLIDDSVVRGTTMEILVEQIRKKVESFASENPGMEAANSVHLRIACPPILAPCFYGIDFPNSQKLIARKHAKADLQAGTLPAEVLASIATELGINSIQFLPVEDMQNIFDAADRGHCMACVTGEYPTAEGQRLYNLQSSSNAEPV